MPGLLLQQNYAPAIIENAINHGLDLLVDEGSITVQVCQDGDDIVFYVRDNGVGMSDELIHAIWNRDRRTAPALESGMSTTG